MMTLLYLLIANAIAHVVSFNQLYKVNALDAVGVFVFILINVLLAGLLWQALSWAPWLILIFTLIGGTGLLASRFIPKKAQWIDYVILLLDTLIAGLSCLYLMR